MHTLVSWDDLSCTLWCLVTRDLHAPYHGRQKGPQCQLALGCKLMVPLCSRCYQQQRQQRCAGHALSWQRLAFQRALPEQPAVR